LELLPKLTGVDAIITDPPYGVGMDYGEYDDNLSDTTALVKAFVAVAINVARVTALTAGKWETELALYQTQPPRWRMCWYKGSQSCASPIGFNDWEAVLVYGEKIHNNAHDYFYAMPEKMGNYNHPCPKPVAYASALIARLVKDGETVCDPFMGSGTIGVAAVRANKNFIGIEKDARYYETAVERIRKEINQGVLL
jgi:DNA modification methylase